MTQIRLVIIEIWWGLHFDTDPSLVLVLVVRWGLVGAYTMTQMPDFLALTSSGGGLVGPLLVSTTDSPLVEVAAFLTSRFFSCTLTAVLISTLMGDT